MDSFIYGGPDLAKMRINLSYFNYDGPMAVTMDDIAKHKIKMYVHFGINTAAVVSVVWIILKKSPQTMKTYKFLLLHIVMWIYLRDVLISLLWMPYFLSPAPCACIVGIMKYLGESLGRQVGMILLIFTSVGTAYSCNIAQFYRFRAFQTAKDDLFRKPKFIIIILLLSVLIPVPGVVSYLLARDPDTDKVSLFLMNTYPFTRSILLKLPCGSVNVSGNRLAQLLFYSLIIVAVLCSATMSIGLLTALLLKLRKKRQASYIPSEINLHRQIITALILQSVLPIFCVGLPSTLLAFHRLSEMKILGAFSAILFEAGSLHSLFNATVIIFMIKPYRTAVLAHTPCLTRIKKTPFIIRISKMTNTTTEA